MEMRVSMLKAFEKFQEDYFKDIELRAKKEAENLLIHKNEKLREASDRLDKINEEIENILVDAKIKANAIIEESKIESMNNMNAAYDKEKDLSVKLTNADRLEKNLKILVDENKDKEAKLAVLLEKNLQKENVLNEKLEKIKALNDI